MSSIFGICNIGDDPVRSQDLNLVKETLNHWNADKSGLLEFRRAGFGHLMLHNTPESIGEQLPSKNTQGHLMITADARIDNREELYSLLRISFADEKSAPDSTIILLLYEKFGDECVKYLLGDFAFVIWDEQQQRLFCARDQLGVRPFFYSLVADFFAFASEKKGLLCLPKVDKTIDEQYYYNQLLWPRIQAEDTTLYKNIRRLPPAHSISFYPQRNALYITKYWTLNCDSNFSGNRDDALDGLLHHFDVAVKCRLRSNYKIGAELSGGLDSSAITGVASHILKAAGKTITTFSNVSEGRDSGSRDECEFANAVIEFNDIDDHVFITKDIWEDPLDEIDFSLKVNDGLEMWSLLWQLPIKQVAKQKGVRTLLSGFPGDEMVTYRGQYFPLDYLDHARYLKYFSSTTERSFNKLKPLLPADLAFILHKMRNAVSINGTSIRRTADFFKIPFLQRLEKGDVAWKDSNFTERYDSYKHYQKYRLLKPQVALRMEAESRFGLSFRTETRFPFADIRLAQYYLSLPNDLKYGGGKSRDLFRNAVHKYLPEKVFQRDDKSGNTAPFRTTIGAMEQRKKLIKDLLNGHLGIKNNIYVQMPDNINSQVALLELLRWHQSDNIRR